MNVTKRERWTEAEIDALPPGEHDYFERKSGLLFANRNNFIGKLAKTISAMANTGGGHILLGVDDSGVPDGLPAIEGRTSIKEWLEQKIPHLVSYPLSDFRVHVVEPSIPSRIPSPQVVVVIDVGDSALAPHQCIVDSGNATKHMYYYRQAGHSVPAPHFHLELLRQRLVSPVLEAKFEGILPIKAARVPEGVFLSMKIRFLLENKGRVPAYKWQINMLQFSSAASDSRNADYRFNTSDYPSGWSQSGGVRIDDTILSGCSLREGMDFGILLRPQATAHIRDEIVTLLSGFKFDYRIATETSPGEINSVMPTTDVDSLAGFVSQQIST